MLDYPSIDDLLNKVNSKYSLAILASKRAHELEGKREDAQAELLESYQSVSYLGKALEEISSADVVIDPDSVTDF